MNSAYSVNIGDSGISFKSANRYDSIKSVMQDLPFLWVLREDEKSQKGEIIGCTRAIVNEITQVVKIGPVAVKPSHQVGMLKQNQE